MRDFALRHFRQIEWYVGLVGFAGLGHLTLSLLDHWINGLGIMFAMLLVFLMAVTKIYLHHIISGIPFWPRRRKRSLTKRQL